MQAKFVAYVKLIKVGIGVNSAVIHIVEILLFALIITLINSTIILENIYPKDPKKEP